MSGTHNNNAPVLALSGDHSGLKEPLHQRIVGNPRQSKTLPALGDTLLPKLLSGEVREPFMEGV